MQEIARRRFLTKYFVRFYVSPKTKAECSRFFLSETGAAPEEARFGGDAPNDWDAARATGGRFVARIPPGDPNRFVGRPGVEKIVENLHELREYLRESVCSSQSHTPRTGRRPSTPARNRSRSPAQSPLRWAMRRKKA